jgi:hypothetical protein
MAHDYYDPKHSYIMQIPYLTDNGSARVVNVGWHDARESIDAGTHRLLHVDGGIYLVTPIKPPATNHIYQIGCEAV